MCGICGIFGSVEGAHIRAMVSAMHHRGPDDSGIFQDDVIALGMARLAIIDVTPGGHQPMSNNNGLIWIVYNGETYNFQQERKLLEEKGHTFISNSDTEVVLSMYEHYGDDFLLRMRGMFALAIFDKRRGPGQERLLLARDHLGIKPLLYARRGSHFVFASEMKAMLASGLVEKEINPEALRLLLTHGSVTQPLTILKGVNMLLPSHRLIIEGGRERIERYWRFETNRFPDLATMPYSELVSVLKKAIDESVRLQMVSDVPLGAFLSGGVDSSLLVALMARNSAHKVKTFSVGFGAEGADIDETDDAEKTAAFIGTDHTRVLVTGSDVRDEIMHIAFALDQPTVDGVNSYFVSKAARTGVTVAISGTGGDELFAGYPWFGTMAKAYAWDKSHPYRTDIRSVFATAVKGGWFDKLSVDHSFGVIDIVRSWSGFLSHYARIYQIFDTRGTAEIMSAEMKAMANVGHEPGFDIVAADELSYAGPLERVSGLCLRGYTQNQLLRDIDAVSMSHSLEVRVPFLDPLVTDIALSLPSKTKLGDVSEIANFNSASYRQTGAKKILIDACKGFLPDGFDLQPKRGFSMPFDSWLKGPLRDVMEDTLSGQTVRRRGFFDVKAVNGVKSKFLSGQQGWSQPWLLMMTELWSREVLDKRY